MTSRNRDVLQKDKISRRWRRLPSSTRRASDLLLPTGRTSLGEEVDFSDSRAVSPLKRDQINNTGNAVTL